MEASRSRRHSVGVPGRRGVVLGEQRQESCCVEGSVMPHQHPADGEQQPGLKPASSEAALSSKRRRRRQSAGGRRHSKGGSSDFSFSPYQPMIIETKSSSVSPRPRRASAPIPPASLLLHKRLMDGKQQETAGTAAGPTIEQCLVLPPGLALKVDGLLSSSQPLSKLGEGPESEDGGSGGGGDGGGGGGGLDQAASIEGGGGDIKTEKTREGGLHAGDERAIISTYTFQPSNSQAAAAKEEASEHVLAPDELWPVRGAVAVSDDGPSDTSDGDAKDGFAKSPGVTPDPGELRCSLKIAPASPEGIDDETAGAGVETTVTVPGDEPAEQSLAAGNEPDVLSSLGGEDDLASDPVGDGKAFDDDPVMADLSEEESKETTGASVAIMVAVAEYEPAEQSVAAGDEAEVLASLAGEDELASDLVGDDKAFDFDAVMADLQEEESKETAGANVATTVAVVEDEPVKEPVAAGDEPDVLASLAGEDELASDLFGDGKAFEDDAVMADLQEEEEAEEEGKETAGAIVATTAAVAEEEPAEEPVAAGDEPDVLASFGRADELASDPVGDGKAFDDDAVIADLQTEEEAEEAGMLDEGVLDGDGIDLYRPASPLACSDKEDEPASDLDGDDMTSGDALMADVQEEVESGSGGVDPHRATASPPLVVQADFEPAAALVDADEAASEESLTHVYEEAEENVVTPQAAKIEATASYGTVEKNDAFPILEAGEYLNVGRRAGAVTGGGGVAAAAAERSGEDDCESGDHIGVKEVAAGTKAAAVQQIDSDVAREELGGGGEVGCIQEKEEESSTSLATEASYNGGDVVVEEGIEHPGPKASEEMAVGVVLASATAAATTRQLGGESGASGVVASEATSTVSCYEATIDKKEGAEKEIEETDLAATASGGKEKPIAADETTASSSTIASEVVHDPAPPAVETKRLESGMADVGDGAPLPSPAVDAHSSHVSGVAVPSVAKDGSGTTAPNVAAQEQEEFPLDWEALAREVEAEWVMEGSDGESEASLSHASLPSPPPATEEVPPSYDVAVAFVESPPAKTPVWQQKEEEVGAGTTTSTGEGAARESASNVLEAPPEAPPEAPAAAAAAAGAATQSSHPRADGSSSGGRGGGSVAFFLEDSKEEAEADACGDYEKQAADDSDCGSAVPALSEGGDLIPANGVRLSTHATATTRNSGGQKQSSAFIPPAGVQPPRAQRPAIGPLPADDAAGSAARVEASLVSVRPPVHGSSVPEQVGGGRGVGSAPSYVPVAAGTTEAAPTFSGGGQDGGMGKPQHPTKESGRGEVGPGGGGCAASCGCVVM